MTSREMLRKLADVVLYADLEELPFPALRTAYGDDFVEQGCAAPMDEELLAKFHVAEALLRLAAGHALPRNVGLADDLASIYAHLGINPANSGDYEP